MELCVSTGRPNPDGYHVQGSKVTGLCGWPKGYLFPQMEEWHQTIDHKETNRKEESFKWTKKVGIILALSLAKFNNCFLYQIPFVLTECYLDKWGEGRWQWCPGFPSSDEVEEAKRMHLGPCCQLLVSQGDYLAQKRSKSITDFFPPYGHSLFLLEFVFLAMWFSEDALSIMFLLIALAMGRTWK